jgi:rubrerythrin
LQNAEVQVDDSDFAELAIAAVDVPGEFRCSDCGYGAIVRRALPPCPMCGGTEWESRLPHLVD